MAMAGLVCLYLEDINSMNAALVIVQEKKFET